MKTNKAILDFLGIEEGKTYIIINSEKIPSYLTSYFTVDIIDDEIVIKDKYSNHISLMELFSMEYKLYKPSLTDRERDLLKSFIDDDVKYIKKVFNVVKRKTFVYIIGEIRELSISYQNINFDGLIEDKTYTPEELGL